MPSDKRARQREARQEKMAELARAKRRSRNLRRSIIAVVVVAAVVGIVYLLVGSPSTKTAAPKGKATTTSSSSSSSTTTSEATTTTEAAVAATCPPATAAGATARETNFKTAPKTCIVPTDTYKATFDTDVGTFVATMSAKANLAAVNNFVFLARYHFFDTTTFFRVLPGFVLQGGSADNTNSGAPAVSEAGYSWTGNTPPKSCVTSKDCYPNYSIAMANAGSTSSNGSEFFIVLPGGGTQLGDLYTFVGQVTSGQSVVAKIGADGSAANNGMPPKVTHHIIKVTISQIPG